MACKSDVLTIEDIQCHRRSLTDLPAMQICWEKLMIRESKHETSAAQGPKQPVPDGPYLFACHLAWQSEGALWAYQELVRALDSPALEIRCIAEALLQRKSPRPHNCLRTA